MSCLFRRRTHSWSAFCSCKMLLRLIRNPSFLVCICVSWHWLRSGSWRNGRRA